MVASYVGVQLWAAVVREARSADAADVLPLLRDRSVKAPGGLVYLDNTNHVWLPSLVGHIGRNNKIDIVWQSSHPIQPIPFPRGKTRLEWAAVLDDLHRQWNGRWQNSAATAEAVQ